MLIGNTLDGSASQDNNAPFSCGLIFSVSTDGSNFTVRHVFNNKDGCAPTGPLYLAPGAANDEGVVYSLVPKTRGFTLLYSFAGKQDGCYPLLGSIGPTGVLCGSTLYTNYGPSSAGTLFQLTPGSSGFAYARLCQFDQGGNSNSGDGPDAPALLPTNQRVGGTNTGLYFYDPAVDQNGVALFLNHGYFDGSEPTVTTGAVIGAGAYGGSTVTQYRDTGCGVIYRWSIPGP